MSYLAPAKLAAASLLFVVLAAAPARSATPPADPSTVGSTFVVNSTADFVAVAPLDSGPCETATGNGICTLRAAIMKANHFPGGGATIVFGLPGIVSHILSIPKAGTDDETTGDLNITASVNIVGNGAANTIIDGNGSATNDRVFNIDNGITVTMSGVTIRNGRSGNLAGGIMNNGTLTLTDCAVVDNLVSGTNDWGGGIFASGSLALTRTVVSGNRTGTSNAHGGGIFAQGALQIVDSTISGNATGGSFGHGGGVYMAFSGQTIRNSTISGNTATYGGGIFKIGATVSVVNSTISSNHAAVNGGGLYASAGAMGLYNVTIAYNLANSDGVGSGNGGGIYNVGGSTVTLANSIVAYNTYVIDTLPFDTLDSNECVGTLTSAGNNMLYLNDTANCVVNGAVTYADPLLGPLQYNGGPTRTLALLAGSQAINASAAANCTDNVGTMLTTDQRGAPRPYPAGGNCDLGAVEAGPPAPLDVDDSHTATKYDALTDGVLLIRYLLGVTGAPLTNGALGGTAQRTDAAAIKTYLDGIRYALDVDDDGIVGAPTDGLMLMRYLFGLRGDALVSSAVGSGAKRTAAPDIETHIQSLVP